MKLLYFFSLFMDGSSNGRTRTLRHFKLNRYITFVSTSREINLFGNAGSTPAPSILNRRNKNMKIKRFERIDSVNAFLKREENKEVVVKRISIVPHNPDIFYVFYEECENLLKTELDELDEIRKIAKEVEKDEEYKKLRNSTQRKIYLLAKYGITNSIAERVIECINMVKILKR